MARCGALVGRKGPWSDEAGLPGFCVCESHSVLCSSLLVTPWTVAHWAPLSMGFSRQESWSGLPCPPPGHLPHPGIELVSHVSCIGRRILYHERHLGSPLNPGLDSGSVDKEQPLCTFCG